MTDPETTGARAQFPWEAQTAPIYFISAREWLGSIRRLKPRRCELESETG